MFDGPLEMVWKNMVGSGGGVQDMDRERNNRFPDDTSSELEDRQQINW